VVGVAGAAFADRVGVVCSLQPLVNQRTGVFTRVFGYHSTQVAVTLALEYRVMLH